MNKSPNQTLFSKVEFTIEEPFDEYDIDYLVDFNWNPEHGAAYWYNSYLNPHVYQDYSNLQDIAYANEDKDTPMPMTAMVLTNPVL